MPSFLCLVGLGCGTCILSSTEDIVVTLFLPLLRSQEDVKMAADYSKVDILYDERNFGKGNGEVMNRLSRGSFRFGRVDQKALDYTGLHMLLDSFEFAVDSWITEWMASSESQVYTIDFLLHKLAEHMCSVSSLRSSPTSTSMIFWTGQNVGIPSQRET